MSVLYRPLAYSGQYESLLDNLTDLQMARQLAQTSEEVAAILNREPGIVILQAAIEKYNAWRKLSAEVIPQAKDLDELTTLYEKHYLNPNIFFTYANWLEIILLHSDYQTLQRITGMHKAGLIVIDQKELKQIRALFPAYPLTVFASIWQAVGKVKDLLLVLDYANFRPRDKERYLLPILDLTLLEELDDFLYNQFLEKSLSTAPAVFAHFYKARPKLGKAFLEKEVLVEADVTLSQLQILEDSIGQVLSSQQAKETTAYLARSLVQQRLQGDYSSSVRDIAWKFLSGYLDLDQDRTYLQNLYTYQRPDTQLWLRSRLSMLI